MRSRLVSRRTALAKSSKKISKAVDSGDYEQLTKALEQADKDVADAARL